MDRYIVLENGAVYKGKAFGAEGERIGELVFTTGMVGYVETLTDPSYYGQIIMQTFPSIGNYGVMREDMESERAHPVAYVVNDYTKKPFNFRTETDIDSFLKEEGIPGVYGVDTRAITRAIRSEGVMNAAITSNPESVDFNALKGYAVKNAVKSVTTEHERVYDIKNPECTVVLYDYGAKANIIRSLNKRGARVISVPSTTPAKRIKDIAPDGIMLSNGPGDPAENREEIAIISKLLGYKPIFGICLGHQLTALAAGAKTIKLKYGHRGANQPVKELETGRTHITSQNHGYAVDSDTVKAGKVSHINANDFTCEGITYPEFDAVTVQFHPEASAGPHDTEGLFDRFIASIKGGKA